MILVETIAYQTADSGTRDLKVDPEGISWDLYVVTGYSNQSEFNHCVFIPQIKIPLELERTISFFCVLQMVFFFIKRSLLRINFLSPHDLNSKFKYPTIYYIIKLSRICIIMRLHYCLLSRKNNQNLIMIL